MGAWWLTVNATDPVTGKRKRVYATVHAPSNKRGAAKADSELAKLVAKVETGRTMPTSGVTVDQLIDRNIDDRAPSCTPGADAETRARVAQHICPHVGSIAIERLRPVDVQQLHTHLRAAGLAEGSVGRELTTEVPTFVPTGLAVTGMVRGELRALREEVLAKLGQEQFVDVRSAEEYRGERLAPEHLPQPDHAVRPQPGKLNRGLSPWTAPSGRSP